MAGYTILTRYAGPTDYRGSCVIATGPAPRSDARLTRATVRYDDAGTPREAHRMAAAAVVAILQDDGWNVTLSPDWYALPDGTGYAFTLDYGRTGTARGAA